MAYDNALSNDVYIDEYSCERVSVNMSAYVILFSFLCLFICLLFFVVVIVFRRIRPHSTVTRWQTLWLCNSPIMYKLAAISVSIWLAFSVVRAKRLLPLDTLELGKLFYVHAHLVPYAVVILILFLPSYAAWLLMLHYSGCYCCI